MGFLRRVADEPILWAALLIWLLLTGGILWSLFWGDSQPVTVTVDLNAQRTEALLGLWTFIAGALVKTWVDADAKKRNAREG